VAGIDHRCDHSGKGWDSAPERDTCHVAATSGGQPGSRRSGSGAGCARSQRGSVYAAQRRQHRFAYCLKFWAAQFEWIPRLSALISIATSHWLLPRQLNWPGNIAFPSRWVQSPKAFAKPTGRHAWSASSETGWSGYWTLRTIRRAWALRAGLNSALADESKPHVSSSVACATSPLPRWRKFSSPFRPGDYPSHSYCQGCGSRGFARCGRSDWNPGDGSRIGRRRAANCCNKADSGLVVVSGSVYLVGEARPLLLKAVEQMETGVHHEPATKSDAAASSVAHQCGAHSLMTLATMVCGSISFLVSLVDKNGRIQHRIARIWGGPPFLRRMFAHRPRP